MSNLIVSDSDLSFYLVGRYEKIPDIPSYLNLLAGPEPDYLRDLFRAGRIEELNKVLDMTEDKVRGYLQGYIQVCIYIPRSPLKPLSRTLVLNKCSVIRLLQKNELHKYICYGPRLLLLKNIPFDYKEFSERVIFPKFLSNELPGLVLNCRGGIYIHDAFKDNFNSYLGLYFMTKKKILPGSR